VKEECREFLLYRRIFMTNLRLQQTN